MKRKSNLILTLVFLAIISFFLWLSWKLESKRDYTPQETIKIKEAPAIESAPVIDNNLNVKG